MQFGVHELVGGRPGPVGGLLAFQSGDDRRVGGVQTPLALLGRTLRRVAWPTFHRSARDGMPDEVPSETWVDGGVGTTDGRGAGRSYRPFLEITSVAERNSNVVFCLD